MIMFLTITILTIGCIGLIEVVSYSVHLRTREITLRKILGATSLQAFILLIREYLVLILISILLGIPLGYYFSQQFLMDYAYRVNLGIVSIVQPVAIICILVVVILGATAFKSSVSKPVSSLNR